MKQPKVTKKTIEQVIDLGEMFDADLTDAPALKEALGQAIIDRMLARTDKNEAYGGGALKSPYSKAYQKSLEFKAAGKKAGDVNMTLTGDMLASIDVLSTSGNKIKIGIADELQILKGFNHQTGDTVPKRAFFGVTKDELKEIGVKFKDDIDALKTQDLTTPAEQRALDLMQAIQDSTGSDIVSED